MSSFEVDYSKLKTSSSDMSAISNTIKLIKQQLENCNSSLRYCLSSSSYANIKKSLASVANSLQQQYLHLNSLSSGLGNIANTYSNTESRIISGKLSFSEIMSALSGYALRLINGESLNDALISSPTLTKEGNLLGISTSGAISGSVLGYNIKGTNKWEFKRDENGKWTDASAKLGIEGSVYGAKGKAEGNIGYLSGSVEGSVLNASASGAIGASLFKDGKLSPALTAELKAKANVAEGEAKAQFGSKDYNVHGKASGSVLGAEAEAKGAIGVISYKDKAGNEVTTIGAQGKAGAEVYAAKGSISGGVTILGIKFDASVEGKAGALGAEASGQITTNGASGSIGGSLGLGVGLKVSVDWSEAADNISNAVNETGKAISKGWNDFSSAMNEGWSNITSGVSQFKFW